MATSPNSDSESEDHTKDPLEDDREVLREEDEREKLLTTSTAFNDGRHGDRERARKQRRRSKRREQKRRRNGGNDDEGTSLYKMEEGGRQSSSQLSSRGSMESFAERETASSRTRVRFTHPRSIRMLIAVAAAGKSLPCYSHLHHHSYDLMPFDTRGLQDVRRPPQKEEGQHCLTVQWHLKLCSDHDTHIS